MTDTPHLFAERPIVLGDDHAPGGVDLLSRLLGAIRLRGDRVFRFAPGSRFALEFGQGVGMVHVFERGAARFEIPGDGRSLTVRAGDILLLARPQAHVIATGEAHQPRPPGRRDLADGDEPAGTPLWLAGSYVLEPRRGGQLLAELPAAIVLPRQEGPAAAGLEIPARQLLVELSRPSQGSAVMISRILDLLFIQVMRAWASQPDADPGWIAAAMDPQIGRALAAVHADPGREWTVESLARVAHLSRSAFAARFVDRTGRTPAGYVAQVRLDVAAEQLRQTRDPVGRIAADVGFRSAASFSRACSRRFGASPRRWRLEADDLA